MHGKTGCFSSVVGLYAFVFDGWMLCTQVNDREIDSPAKRGLAEELELPRLKANPGETLLQRVQLKTQGRSLTSGCSEVKQARGFPTFSFRMSQFQLLSQFPLPQLKLNALVSDMCCALSLSLCVCVSVISFVTGDAIDTVQSGALIWI